MTDVPKTITKRMLDCLSTTAWGMKHFGGITTNRQLPLTVMRQCVDAGLCRCVGMVGLCDDDGFLMETRRERLGYVLTEQGRKVLDDYRESQKVNNA